MSHQDADQQDRRDTETASPGQGHDVIVIGASAGGLVALRKLIAGLPADFAASVFIVVHIAPSARSELAEILERAGLLAAVTAVDGMAVRPGQIVVAPADHHMLLEPGRVRVVRGPLENRHRPAIDPLFRSAAWSYGPRVVGVVLTGYLDDGSAGLWAIRSCGGVTVVQDPSDAAHPDMPINALRMSDVDHCVPLDRMPALLVELAATAVTSPQPVPPPGLKSEIEFAGLRGSVESMSQMGQLSTFTCPSCGGALWEIDEGPRGRLRYRCHTGHAFSGNTLLAEQGQAIENGLFAALRAVEERSVALRRLGERLGPQLASLQAEYQRKAVEMDRAGDVLRGLLAHLPQEDRAGGVPEQGT